MSDKKDKLRKQVMNFIRSQPGYKQEKQEHLWLTFENETYIVRYGKDEMAGIMGFGKDIDLAFADFERSWKQLNGFEWIKKNQ